MSVVKRGMGGGKRDMGERRDLVGRSLGGWGSEAGHTHRDALKVRGQEQLPGKLPGRIRENM